MFLFVELVNGKNQLCKHSFVVCGMESSPGEPHGVSCGVEFLDGDTKKRPGSCIQAALGVGEPLLKTGQRGVSGVQAHRPESQDRRALQREVLPKSCSMSCYPIF